jgi:hypothetical protein
VTGEKIRDQTRLSGMNGGKFGKYDPEPTNIRLAKTYASYRLAQKAVFGFFQ